MSTRSRISQIPISNISYSFWTAEHDTLLRKDYHLRRLPALSAQTGHGVGAIRRRASTLGLRRIDDYSASDVAIGIGCSLPTVTRWITRRYIVAIKQTAPPAPPRYRISHEKLCDFFRDPTKRHLWSRFAGDARWISGFLD